VSEIGLFSDLYQLLHEIAELTDEVIIAIKTNDEKNRMSIFEELSGNLSNIADKGTKDISSRIIANILQKHDTLTFSEIDLLSQKLLVDPHNQQVIYSLEQLAKILDHEQISVIARMRGASS